MGVIGYKNGTMELVILDRAKTAYKLFRRISKGMEQLEECGCPATTIVVSAIYKNSMLEASKHLFTENYRSDERYELYGVPTSFKQLKQGCDFIIFTDSYTEEESPYIIHEEVD